MLNAMTLIRYGCVFFAFGVLIGCDAEQREVTPYGYYAPETSFSTEVPRADPQPQQRPSTPWLPPSDDYSSDPIVPDAPFPVPAGPSSSAEEQAYRSGLNGVGRRFLRRVVTDQQLIGIHCRDSTCLALSSAGGIFTSTPFGDWEPRVTSLPPLSRSFGTHNQIVACPSSGSPALASTDWGLSWATLNFPCGQNGRRTIDFRSDQGVAIVGQRIRVGNPVSGVHHWIDSPVAAPTALTALGSTIMVFGPGTMAVSEDAGLSFSPGESPPGLLEVRDAVLDPKGLLAVVGRARAGHSPIAVSVDGGRSWQSEPRLPIRTAQLDYVLIDGERSIIASALTGDSEAIYSSNMGRLWGLVEADVPLRGALTLYGQGTLFGTPQGIAVPVGERGIYRMGLDQPLLDVAFAGPMRAIGAGVNGGLYRTLDAGRTWHLVPGTRGLPMTHLARVGDSLLAIGPGFYRWSDSAGRRWFSGQADASCEPRWLTVIDRVAVAGCEGGTLSMSRDHGQTWNSVAPPQELAQVFNAEDGGEWVALANDGSTWFMSSDQGSTWSEVSMQISSPIQDVSVNDSGVLFTTEGGAIGILRRSEDSLVWLTDLLVHRLHDVRQVQLLDSGRMVVLDAHALWILGPEGHLESRIPASDGRSFRLSGDGGIMLLGQTASTHFTRVRAD